MPSPEGRGGQPTQPEEPGKELEQPPYSLVARFLSETRAKQAYFDAQEFIFNDPRADLSVYRFQLDRVNHVAAVGEPPPEELDQQLRAIMARGDPTPLPADILNALYERRVQMKKRGDWVEGHYRSGKKLDY